MTVTIGWWALPSLITFAAVVWSLWPQRKTGYGADIVGAFQLLGAIIVTLLAWLIWSLFA